MLRPQHALRCKAAPLVSIDHRLLWNTVVAGVVRRGATRAVSLAGTALAARKSLHIASKPLRDAINLITGSLYRGSRKSSAVHDALCRARAFRNWSLSDHHSHANAYFLSAGCSLFAIRRGTAAV